MKKTLLLVPAFIALVSCDSKKDAIGPLSSTETEILSEFSNSIETGLLAIEGTDLFEAGETKLSKTTTDWLSNCDYLEDRDGRNRVNGRTVTGAICPITAQWRETSTGANTSAISISYLLKQSGFGTEIPVQRLQIRGTRKSEIEDGEIVTTATYNGTAKNQFGDEFKFTATRSTIAVVKGLTIKELPYTYDLSVTFGGATYKGRTIPSGTSYVNGSKITSDEFQTLFFILK